MLSCKHYTQTEGFAKPGGTHLSKLSCKHYTQIECFAKPGGTHFKYVVHLILQVQEVGDGIFLLLGVYWCIVFRHLVRHPTHHMPG